MKLMIMMMMMMMMDASTTKKLDSIPLQSVCLPYCPSLPQPK